MKYVKALIRRYNDDESVQRYLESARRTQEIVNNATEIVLAVTAIDPQAEIAKLVVQRLEEQAVVAVSDKLQSDLNKIAQNGFDKGLTRAQAMASISEHERWVNRVTREAINQAQSHINQRPDSGNTETRKATVNINTSSSARTTQIKLTEGTAKRQLRDVAKNGWSGVLNEKKN